MADGLDPVKSKKLRFSLYSITSKSLNDIYLRGEAIRRKMESIGGYKGDQRNDKGRKRRERDDSSRRYRDRRDVRKEGDKGAEQRRDRDNTVFNPLNTLISKIFHEIKGKPRFVRPHKLKTHDYKKNGDKYCDYHKDKGHNTEECYHLKKLIEKMVKEGELKQYIGDLRDKLGLKEDRKRKPKERECYSGEVKTISGGSMLDWDSKTAKKNISSKCTTYTSSTRPNNPYPSFSSRMITRM